MCERSSETLGRLADQLGWGGLLTAAVDGLVGCSTDELSEEQLAREMATVKRAATRLESRLALLFDARRRRAVQRGRDAAGGDVNAGVRAARQLEQDVAGELGLGNGQAKRIAKAGRAIARDPDASAAAKEGRVSAEHVRVLDETLRDLDDLDLANRLRRELLAQAAELDLYAFRRACRRALAEADQAAAVRAEDRRQGRRSARTFETDDGMLGLSARLSGIDAETVATAIDAYRRPDAADQQRRPEQRTADALVDLCTVALRHVDSTSHGHPPQILLVIDRTNLTGLLDRTGPVTGDTVTDLAGRPLRHAVTHGAGSRQHRDRNDGRNAGAAGATGAGVVESVWCGPLPDSELTLVQAQALVTLIARGGGRPTFVTTHARQVPSGLWPLLVARDGGCIAEQCEVPAGWCDIVHLHVDYDPGGRLSEANAALVCRRHHRAYDHATRPLAAIWTHDRPILVRRDRIPDGARRIPPDHLIPPDGPQGPVPGRRVPVIDPATRRPTGRWLPAAPSDTEIPPSTADDESVGPATGATARTAHGAPVGGTTGVTIGRALETPAHISHGPGDTDRTDRSDRTDRDGHGYRRHRTVGQPSLLAEPHGTYRTRAGPPTARSSGPTAQEPRGPTTRRECVVGHRQHGRDGPDDEGRREPDRWVPSLDAGRIPALGAARGR